MAVMYPLDSDRLVDAFAEDPQGFAQVIEAIADNRDKMSFEVVASWLNNYAADKEEIDEMLTEFIVAMKNEGFLQADD